MQLSKLFSIILNNPLSNSIRILPSDSQLRKYFPILSIKAMNWACSKEHLKLIYQHSCIPISKGNQTYPKSLDLNSNFQERYFLSFFFFFLKSLERKKKKKKGLK